VGQLLFTTPDTITPNQPLGETITQHIVTELTQGELEQTVESTI